MLSWQQIVENYIIRHSNLICRVTAPLRERFNIQYFTYHRINKKGKYTVLVDRPDWAEHYVEEKFYLLDPYLRHPDVYQSGFCLIEQHGSEEYRQKILKDGKEIFNLDQGITLIKKQADYVEFFGFAANKAASQLEKLYLNHSWVLHSFADHFKQELKSVLLRMEAEAGGLAHLKGMDFYTNQPINPDICSDVLENYIKDLGRGSNKIACLSVREKECIQHLLLGRSARETGYYLNLSPRTVEFYFENIKNKWNCSSKREILSQAKQFESMIKS